MTELQLWFSTDTFDVYSKFILDTNNYINLVNALIKSVQGYPLIDPLSSSIKI